MKVKLFYLYCLSILIAVASCKKSDGIETSGTTTGGSSGSSSNTLKGHIKHFDSSGNLIWADLAGTVVSVDGTSLSSTTDSNGLFSFSGLSIGVYNLSVGSKVTTSGTYGPTKIQNIAFTGGGDIYPQNFYDGSVGLIPTSNPSSIAISATASTVQLTGTTSSAIDGAVIIYVGRPGSTTVSPAPADHRSIISGTANTTTTFVATITIAKLYQMGYSSGSTVYLAAGLANTSYPGYYDYPSGKSVYSAISTNSVTGTVTLP